MSHDNKEERGRYLATVAKGEATSLQGDKSDVKLEIQKGCPKRAYLMEVRTDPKSFSSVIPDDECFISPIVEVLAPARTETSSYTLRIPHCLDEDDDRTKVKVRLVHENQAPAVVEVPKGNAGALYYDIDARFIELHTKHFTTVICTICQTPYHCRGRINSFWFARFDTQEQKTCILHDVEIRLYFGGVIHSVVDFRQVMLVLCNQCIYFHVLHLNHTIFLSFQQSIEETVNLKCVTNGSLKIPRRQFNLESGQMKFSLRVKDSAWEPRVGIEKWDAVARTLAEVRRIHERPAPSITLNVHFFILQ